MVSHSVTPTDHREQEIAGPPLKILPTNHRAEYFQLLEEKYMVSAQYCLNSRFLFDLVACLIHVLQR